MFIQFLLIEKAAASDASFGFNPFLRSHSSGMPSLSESVATVPGFKEGHALMVCSNAVPCGKPPCTSIKRPDLFLTSFIILVSKVSLLQLAPTIWYLIEGFQRSFSINRKYAVGRINYSSTLFLFSSIVAHMNA